MNSATPESLQNPKLPEAPYGAKLSWGRWIFLGVISLALCTFLPLVLFAPVPIVMAFLLFGRMKGIMLGIATMIFLSVLSFKFQAAIATGGVYLMAFVYAVIIAEIIYRGIHPVIGLIKGGLAVIFALVLLGGLFSAISDVTFTGELEKVVISYADQIKAQQVEILSSSGEEGDMIRDFVSEPTKLVKEIVNWLPAALFVGVFIGIWASFFVVLRNTVVWIRFQNYQYTLKDLVDFKVPDYFIYPVILGLILALTGEAIMGPIGPVIGGNLLYCIGIFYFFQGFGIFIEFIGQLKMARFIRTILIITGIFMAWRVIVLVGVFDVWVNFRRFFKNNNKNIDKEKNRNKNNDHEGEQ